MITSLAVSLAVLRDVILVVPTVENLAASTGETSVGMTACCWAVTREAMKESLQHNEKVH